MTTMRSTSPTKRRPLEILLVLSLLGSTMISAFADGSRVYPLAGDFNGDGVTTPGWFVDGVFVLYGATGSGDTVRFHYGRPGDVPVVGDWTGDKRDTVGVVRNGRRWLLRDSNTGGNADRTFVYGGWLGQDRPVVGDWSGKGYDAPGVVRGSTWHLRKTLSAGNADITFTYGRRGDTPITGAWANNGRDTAGIVRDGVWHLRESNSGGSADWVFKYGRPGDMPVAGNWDGRGGDTPGVVRGATWMLKNALSGGSADVVLDLADPAIDGALAEAEVTATREPTRQSVAAPQKTPSPKAEPEPKPEPSTDEGESATPGTAESETSPTVQQPDSDGARLLYAPRDVDRYRVQMTGVGPYFSSGDAGHGGAYSPGDGARSVRFATEFLAKPQASYWIQEGLPLSSGDPWPSSDAYVRPMHAAWIYMTQPDHPERDALKQEVKALLLHHAAHPSHDFSDSTKYPVDYPGYSPSPIFGHAHWMTRLIKARDMLGRESFTSSENAVVDRWFYDYANWGFQWLHNEAYVKVLPGRENRDYTRIRVEPNASRASYDGGPLIGSLARAYTNRHAAIASTASLAANYLEFHDYVAPGSGGPEYGRFTVDRLLLHSRLFVEETIRFSVFPQGFQGDFERGSSSRPQAGWLYSSNVLANLVEIAEYHAKRGDMSVWNYGTSQGFDGTAGVPIAGNFSEKNLHFYAWSMSRYVNNGWGRTNHGEPLALPHYYHDVIPAATVARFAGDDRLLRDAWRRSGSAFPPYPRGPQSQGRWDARLGEGAKSVGLIEHGGATPLG